MEGGASSSTTSPFFRDAEPFCRWRLFATSIVAFLVISVMAHFQKKVLQLIQISATNYSQMRVSGQQMESMPPPLLSPALDCLRKTTPQLRLEYPPDAQEHFREIHRTLYRWSQRHPSHRMHSAAGYRGPWIENHFISTFEGKVGDSFNSSFPFVNRFGPYIPIFVPWVDIWVNNGFKYPAELLGNLSAVLRPNVPYITVCQNAEGLTGKNEIPMETVPNILVLSAGGYGHVPIPLIKQEERIGFSGKIPQNRTYDVTYVGKLGNAPRDMRSKMDQHFQNMSFLEYKWHYGRDWRDLMADSRFSLAPRGFGRTSYHLMEILQSGLIPIHIYSDIPWVPYSDLFKDIGFTSHFSAAAIKELTESLRNLPTAVIAAMEERILKLKESHFMAQGIMDQIQRFMLNQKNDLRCQELPRTVRDE